MADEPRAEALAWIDKADQDVLAASLIHHGQGPPTVGCFLCQQAIEKLLKSVLVLHGEVPPRSHDLVDLHRRLAGRGGAIGVSASDLAAWTHYAVAARYPGFGDPQAELDLPGLLAFATDLAGRLRRLAAADSP
jgi:HEPN domain-containing protein